MKTDIKYKGYVIEIDNLLGYSLKHNYEWLCSDSTIESLKETVDMILEQDHLDWLITYYDKENNELNHIIESDCLERMAEQRAIKNKPADAENWSVLQIGVFIWQKFSMSKWWPECQNNNIENSLEFN